MQVASQQGQQHSSRTGQHPKACPLPIDFDFQPVDAAAHARADVGRKVAHQHRQLRPHQPVLRRHLGNAFVQFGRSCDQTHLLFAQHTQALIDQIVQGFNPVAQLHLRPLYARQQIGVCMATGCQMPCDFLDPFQTVLLIDPEPPAFILRFRLGQRQTLADQGLALLHQANRVHQRVQFVGCHAFKANLQSVNGQVSQDGSRQRQQNQRQNPCRRAGRQPQPGCCAHGKCGLTHARRACLGIG
jgi:hypothetical protein